MDLETIEQIRAVKYRYLRCLDLKRWDEFAETLTPDATGAYGSPSGGRPLTFGTRDEIVDYMRRSLSNDIITVHVCNHPEIAVDGDEASGSWCLEDTVIVPQHQVIIRGAAYYADRYRREDGAWLIAHTGYERIYETITPFAGGTQLTASLWTPAPVG
jgi:hypothetical protein